jgi:hypothetical protein
MSRVRTWWGLRRGLVLAQVLVLRLLFVEVDAACVTNLRQFVF